MRQNDRKRVEKYHAARLEHPKNGRNISFTARSPQPRHTPQRRSSAGGQGNLPSEVTRFTPVGGTVSGEEVRKHVSSRDAPGESGSPQQGCLQRLVLQCQHQQHWGRRLQRVKPLPFQRDRAPKQVWTGTRGSADALKTFVEINGPKPSGQGRHAFTAEGQRCLPSRQVLLKMGARAISTPPSSAFS